MPPNETAPESFFVLPGIRFDGASKHGGVLVGLQEDVEDVALRLPQLELFADAAGEVDLEFF